MRYMNTGMVNNNSRDLKQKKKKKTIVNTELKTKSNAIIWKVLANLLSNVYMLDCSLSIRADIMYVIPSTTTASRHRTVNVS
jgi:hypothetical protein